MFTNPKNPRYTSTSWDTIELDVTHARLGDIAFAASTPARVMSASGIGLSLRGLVKRTLTSGEKRVGDKISIVFSANPFMGYSKYKRTA